MSEQTGAVESSRRRRLAIIGCGSSGLISLKTAIDLLGDWDIVCFEKSDNIVGCWGNPYPGFVSTSTKYTTQFACYPIYDASVRDDGGKSRAEFFCDDEYGKYLQRFANKFDLHLYIRLLTSVQHVRRLENERAWELKIRCCSGDQAETTVEHFDALIICTGLAAEPKQVSSDIPVLELYDLNHPAGLGHITGKRIVVLGGGESAVDYANRLSRADLNNQVYLSLQSGIRVSPRYHPIRGVPSDFLRNRLMLSIHEDMRNWIGQHFVEMRIKYQERFERWFPGRRQVVASTSAAEVETVRQRKDWALKLTLAAKDDLFNMFHNKSDDFLDSVAAGRIRIIGPAVDDSWMRYRLFDSEDTVDVTPDCIVPAIGYRSTLESLSSGVLRMQDFYLGCVHSEYRNVFLVGFARPIIGNIPSISEMQATYVGHLLSERISRPPRLCQIHELDRRQSEVRFSKLNLAAIYPVEMFPYCDLLAHSVGCYPKPSSVRNWVTWCRMQLTPATTMHYFNQNRETTKSLSTVPIYMPATLILVLLLLKPVDWLYRLLRCPQSIAFKLVCAQNKDTHCK